MAEKNEKIGESIVIEADDYTAVEKTCWSKFRQMQENGLDAGGFIIRRLEILNDGKCNAVIQPIKIS
ncbi:MAG: hypothetical protein RBS77_00335 [Candidatus Moranbacteria bacterium]|jgi:hypothetical protein|nr:hypothetical protein [Candidatus Moranbacteria bacterium]